LPREKRRNNSQVTGGKGELFFRFSRKGGAEKPDKRGRGLKKNSSPEKNIPDGGQSGRKSWGVNVYRKGDKGGRGGLY